MKYIYEGELAFMLHDNELVVDLVDGGQSLADWLSEFSPVQTRGRITFERLEDANQREADDD